MGEDGRDRLAAAVGHAPGLVFYQFINKGSEFIAHVCCSIKKNFKKPNDLLVPAPKPDPNFIMVSCLHG
jgi:hypothetical protein